MATDLDTDEDGRLYADEFGDYATVSGDGNVKAQIKNAVARELVDVPLSPLNEDTKRNVRRGVRDGLNEISYVDSIIAVKLFTPTDEELEIEVQTRSNDLRFSL